MNCVECLRLIFFRPANGDGGSTCVAIKIYIDVLVVVAGVIYFSFERMKFNSLHCHCARRCFC